jgi:hypothetical protein
MHLPGEKFKAMRKEGQQGIWRIIQVTVNYQRVQATTHMYLGYWPSEESFLKMDGPTMTTDAHFLEADKEIDKLEAAIYACLKREFEEFSAIPVDDLEMTVPEVKCGTCGKEFHKKDVTTDRCECNDCEGCGLEWDDCTCPDGPFNALNPK